MTLDFKGKGLVTGALIIVVAAPLGIWGFKSARAQAAGPRTAVMAAPLEQAAPAPTHAAAPHTYKVVEGDTLWSVAEQAGVSVASLAKANNIREDDVLSLGQELIIPNENGDAPKQADASTANSATITPWHTYKVAEGDTLSSIAQQAGVSVDAISIANNLNEDEVLSLGKELIIPNTDGIIHTTTEGDSLWYLANLYQVDLDTIIKANPQVNADTMAPGTVLFIPGGKVPRPRTPESNRGSVDRETPAQPAAPTVPATPAPAPEKNSSAAFDRWPTSGPITSGYGWRDDPISGQRKYHNGLDIGAPSGQSVYAVASGRVVMAGWYGDFGNTVIVDHLNGLSTQYSHLSRMDVSVGERLSSGQRVGLVGSTGYSTGAHLHFTVQSGGKVVNPLNYLP